MQQGGSENTPLRDGAIERIKLPRFDIASALAKPFQGLSSAVESNLHRACRVGDCEWIRNVLEGRAESYPPSEDNNDVIKGKSARHLINERNRLGASPLWLAAIAGHSEALKLLITCGANLETEDIKGQTPLYAATKFNHVESVAVLLEAGANPDGSETNISTPIYVTARDNFPVVMALLIKHGADVNGRHSRTTRLTNSRADYPGNLPVYMTLVYRHYECFRQLVKGGADLCLPPALNGAGGSTSLLNGIMRYACDARYAELLALCGGIKVGAEMEELLCIFRSRSNGPARNREDCLRFLDIWKTEPMSLRNASRIAIRHRMGQKRLQFVEQLTLPKLLKDYVSMSLLEI